MPRFSVICATLLRSSYAALIASVRRQTFRDFEFIGRADSGPGVNEYVVRNRAARQAAGDWLVWVDDDSELPSGYLARLSRTVSDRPNLVAVSGCLRGNFSGRGVETIDQSGWWIGACMAVRRDVFLERPFEESWGLGHIPKGWRADSDMGFSIEKRYPDGWTHDAGLIVEHPGAMGSSFQPDVEAVFFQRWRSKIIDRFISVDFRLQQFLLETQDLSPEELAKVVNARRAMRKVVPKLPVLPQES